MCSCPLPSSNGRSPPPDPGQDRGIETQGALGWGQLSSSQQLTTVLLAIRPFVFASFHRAPLRKFDYPAARTNSDVARLAFFVRRKQRLSIRLLIARACQLGVAALEPLPAPASSGVSAICAKRAMSVFSSTTSMTGLSEKLVARYSSSTRQPWRSSVNPRKSITTTSQYWTRERMTDSQVSARQ